MNPATIIELLLSNLWPLLPFRILRADEWGARWKKWGTEGEALGPGGVYWCLYFMHPFDRCSSGESMEDLPTLSVVTSDDYAVCVSGNFGWKVKDPVAYFEKVDNVSAALIKLSANHIAKHVRKRKYTETVKNLDSLEASLKRTLQTQANEWGVTITRVGLADFVPSTQAIRLFQDPGSRAF